MSVKNISTHPLHLGLGAKILSEPEFDGMPWYDAYEKRHAGDGAEGRLVTMYTFNESWRSWEMHPCGDEVVICLSGEMELVQEIEGREVRTTLRTHEYAINPPGVWHTADVSTSATALFITAGLGTQHRQR